MSSQGANATVFSEYGYPISTLRDSSDYTIMKKQRIVYADPKNQNTTNTNNTTDKFGLSYEKYGSEFRLTFLNGRFKCINCTANAFSGNGLRSGT
jgi:hypothetical protein